MNCLICGVPAKKIPLCRKHYMQKYNRENREYLAAKAYERAQSVEYKKTQAEYRAATRDKILAYKANYRATQKEKIRLASRKYYEENKNQVRASVIKYYRENPEAVRAWRTNRRARVRNAEGSHSAAEIKVLLKSQGGMCAICHLYMGGKYHKDHIMPLCLGGSNYIQNIQLTHGACNQKKHDKHPEAFQKEIEAIA